MKSNKGFTLIELLAVIVILAIIALIATPIILDVIDTAKKGAKESSALGYIDAAEKQVMLAQVDTTATKIATPGTYEVSSLTTLKVEVKGEEPKATGIVTFGLKGEVTEAWLEFDDYKVYYDGEKAVADKSKYIDKDNNEKTVATANCTASGCAGASASTPSTPSTPSTTNP